MSPDDPIRKVQRLSRPELLRRFYRTAGFATVAEGYTVLLDGRPLRTPGRRTMVLPTRELAEGVVGEWQAQETVIDPETMPLTRLANVAIDGVADRVAEVRAEIVAYAGSDLVCYRAGEPEGLVARQEAEWRPLVDWAAAALGARLRLAVGVMHVEQDPAALAAIARAVEAFHSFRLAALHTVTTLTGSAVVALALAERHVDAAKAWRAAFVDEDWQIGLWGEDAEARANRERRRREFDAAVVFLHGSEP